MENKTLLNHRNILATFLIAPLLLLQFNGCLQLAHLQSLRQAQDRFSEIASKENNYAFLAIMPSKLEAKSLEKDASSGKSGIEISGNIPFDEAEFFYREYRGIYLHLQALQRRAKNELQADNLTANAAVLEVLAYWRMVFFQHLLRGDTLVRDGEIIQAQSDTAVSSVRAFAQNTLKKLNNNKVMLSPRDRFLLNALPALIRYDIAYLNTLEAVRLKKIDAAGNNNHQKQAKEFINQMAKAEKELAEIAVEESHLQRYQLLARFTILSNARTLASYVRIVRSAEVKSQLPELFKRLCILRADRKNLLDLGLTLKAIGAKLPNKSDCENK